MFNNEPNKTLFLYVAMSSNNRNCDSNHAKLTTFRGQNDKINLIHYMVECVQCDQYAPPYFTWPNVVCVPHRSNKSSPFYCQRATFWNAAHCLTCFRKQGFYLTCFDDVRSHVSDRVRETKENRVTEYVRFCRCTASNYVSMQVLIKNNWISNCFSDGLLIYNTVPIVIIFD